MEDEPVEEDPSLREALNAVYVAQNYCHRNGLADLEDDLAVILQGIGIRSDGWDDPASECDPNDEEYESIEMHSSQSVDDLAREADRRYGTPESETEAETAPAEAESAEAGSSSFSYEPHESGQTVSSIDVRLCADCGGCVPPVERVERDDGVYHEYCG